MGLLAVELQERGLVGAELQAQVLLTANALIRLFVVIITFISIFHCFTACVLFQFTTVQIRQIIALIMH